MKITIFHGSKLLLIVLALTILSTSCEYQDITDAEYPDQLIYMPAAKHGIFNVNTVALPIGSTPTPGNPYRYLVDLDENRFSIPLGVYRSGVNNDGVFSVEITVNTDTINQLMVDEGRLPKGTLHLPSNNYSMATIVEMDDGQELAPFSLDIDLDFLIANAPGKNYAIGVTIASALRETNPELETTVILIGTDMMLPVADFTGSAASDPKTWNFINNSDMAVEYSWDFGDGSPASTEKNTSHTYENGGVYTVTLTAYGVTGEQNKSTHSLEVTVL